jgi:hypothetical protein
MNNLTTQFLTWCRSKPEGETFNPWNCNECVGFQFLEAHGLQVQECYVTLWTDRVGQSHELPKPISDAIHWACGYVDDGNTVTFGSLVERLEASLGEGM